MKIYSLRDIWIKAIAQDLKDGKITRQEAMDKIKALMEAIEQRGKRRKGKSSHSWRSLFQFLFGCVMSVFKFEKARQNYLVPALITYNMNLKYLKRAHRIRDKPNMHRLISGLPILREIFALFISTAQGLNEDGSISWSYPQAEEYLEIFAKRYSYPKEDLYQLIKTHESQKNEIRGLIAQIKEMQDKKEEESMKWQDKYARQFYSEFGIDPSEIVKVKDRDWKWDLLCVVIPAIAYAYTEIEGEIVPLVFSSSHPSYETYVHEIIHVLIRKKPFFNNNYSKLWQMLDIFLPLPYRKDEQKNIYNEAYAQSFEERKGFFTTLINEYALLPLAPNFFDVLVAISAIILIPFGLQLFPISYLLIKFISKLPRSILQIKIRKDYFKTLNRLKTKLTKKEILEILMGTNPFTMKGLSSKEKIEDSSDIRDKDRFDDSQKDNSSLFYRTYLGLGLFLFICSNFLPGKFIPRGMTSPWLVASLLAGVVLFFNVFSFTSQDRKFLNNGRENNNEEIKAIKDTLAKLLLIMSVIDFIGAHIMDFPEGSEVNKKYYNKEQEIIRFGDLCYRGIDKKFGIEIVSSGGNIFRFSLPPSFSEEEIQLWQKMEEKIKKDIESMVTILKDLLNYFEKNKDNEVNKMNERLDVPYEKAEEMLRNSVPKENLENKSNIEYFGCGLILPKRWLKEDGLVDLFAIGRYIKKIYLKLKHKLTVNKQPIEKRVDKINSHKGELINPDYKFLLEYMGISFKYPYQDIEGIYVYPGELDLSKKQQLSNFLNNLVNYIEINATRRLDKLFPNLNKEAEYLKFLDYIKEANINAVNLIENENYQLILLDSDKFALIISICPENDIKLSQNKHNTHSSVPLNNITEIFDLVEKLILDKTLILTKIPIFYQIVDASLFKKELVCVRGVLEPFNKVSIKFLEIIKNIDVINKKIIDIGTGSGVLASAVALKGASEVKAIDIDDLALAVAQYNVERLGLQDRVKICKGDLFESINISEDEKFDLILAALPLETKENKGIGHRFIQSLSQHVNLDGKAYAFLLYKKGGDYTNYEGIMDTNNLLYRCLDYYTGYTLEEKERLDTYGIYEIRFKHPQVIVDNIAKLTMIAQEIGLPLKITCETSSEHYKTYLFLRDDLGLKNKFQSLTDDSKPNIPIAWIDAHPDDEPLGDELNAGNVVSHIYCDFNNGRGGMWQVKVPVQISLFGAISLPNDSKHFEGGIWNSYDDWPENWLGIVSLDLDYFIREKFITLGHPPTPEEIAQSIESLVELWSKKNVGLLGLHIDKGLFPKDLLDFALGKLADAFIKHKDSFISARGKLSSTLIGKLILNQENDSISTKSYISSQVIYNTAYKMQEEKPQNREILVIMGYCVEKSEELLKAYAQQLGIAEDEIKIAYFDYEKKEIINYFDRIKDKLYEVLLEDGLSDNEANLWINRVEIFISQHEGLHKIYDNLEDERIIRIQALNFDFELTEREKSYFRKIIRGMIKDTENITHSLIVNNVIEFLNYLLGIFKLFTIELYFDVLKIYEKNFPLDYFIESDGWMCIYINPQAKKEVDDILISAISSFFGLSFKQREDLKFLYSTSLNKWESYKEKLENILSGFVLFHIRSLELSGLEAADIIENLIYIFEISQRIALDFPPETWVEFIKVGKDNACKLSFFDFKRIAFINILKQFLLTKNAEVKNCARNVIISLIVGEEEKGQDFNTEDEDKSLLISSLFNLHKLYFKYPRLVAYLVAPLLENLFFSLPAIFILWFLPHLWAVLAVSVAIFISSSYLAFYYHSSVLQGKDKKLTIASFKEQKRIFLNFFVMGSGFIALGIFKAIPSSLTAIITPPLYFLTIVLGIYLLGVLYHSLHNLWVRYWDEAELWLAGKKQAELESLEISLRELKDRKDL
ncbi:MAG: 50S ribosomal protein L11 methyltransferase, partial [Candidatus Omnitrophica bacterium]|nr:50S ribosomal protein L11 methyltransferase [Candidatus Omnitrophota bacterium]